MNQAALGFLEPFDLCLGFFLLDLGTIRISARRLFRCRSRLSYLIEAVLGQFAGTTSVNEKNGESFAKLANEASGQGCQNPLQNSPYLLPVHGEMVEQLHAIDNNLLLAIHSTC